MISKSPTPPPGSQQWRRNHPSGFSEKRDTKLVFARGPRKCLQVVHALLATTLDAMEQFRSTNDLLRTIPLLSRLLPRPPPGVVPETEIFEEEEVSKFRSGRFYPVTIGQILDDRYVVIGKLGYGGNSTVWLCKEIRYASPTLRLCACANRARTQNYVVLKINAWNSIQGQRELANYRHLACVQELHPGKENVQNLLGFFWLPYKGGVHLVLVQPPLAMSLDSYLQSCPLKTLPRAQWKGFVNRILVSLDYLHTKVGLVHTGT